MILLAILNDTRLHRTRLNSLVDRKGNNKILFIFKLRILISPKDTRTDKISNL